MSEITTDPFRVLMNEPLVQLANFEPAPAAVPPSPFSRLLPGLKRVVETFGTGAGIATGDQPAGAHFANIAINGQTLQVFRTEGPDGLHFDVYDGKRLIAASQGVAAQGAANQPQAVVSFDYADRGEKRTVTVFDNGNVMTV